ncbi:DUF2529 family protein [Pontibacillus litoralis]|uniref:DUF2529 domain-containing protein n=1 Tax=Pontibacillus litoralis JSM 072002 TaxID=1385512 RepID=A0A0A5G5V0_9BACI|nr:DUF2529 family protein [Pontibacillus litoralis]KGX86470.1 hypothetical protein N784_04765 [Pontibacillus litoralis JSM 072002]
MLKMFSTQLTGTFQRINEKQGNHIEDAARALAQAIVGDGHIYVCGTGEMVALHDEIEQGAEKLPKTSIFREGLTLTPLDRVIVASRHANDEAAIKLTKHIQAQGAEVIQISSTTKEDNPLQQLANYHIDTQMTGPMLPFDMERIGFPTLMGMLYVYHALYLTTKEIISEYE